MTSEQKSFDPKTGKAEYAQTMLDVESGKKKEMLSYAIFSDDYPSHFEYKDDMMVNVGRYEQSGNATHVKYDAKIERGDGHIVVSCDDWAFMVDEDNVMNQIKCRKFGINVFTLVMHISKVKSK